MVKEQRARPRLDRQAWARAALGALARGGPGMVAVEPVARELGATKGSFYWHFPDRRALLIAALELYEQEGTEAVITGLAGRPDQLRRLFSQVFRNVGGDPVYRALLAAAADPDVGPVLRRITRRRVDYLITAMAQAGYPPAEARHRAVLAYTSWLGLAQAEYAAGGELFSSEQARDRYLRFLLDAILPPGRGRA